MIKIKEYLANHPQIERRFCSFMWRFLPAVSLFAIGFLTDWIDSEFKEETTIMLVISYLLNEVTKYLNKKT